jgi:hypothetical protein
MNLCKTHNSKYPASLKRDLVKRLTGTMILGIGLIIGIASFFFANEYYYSRDATTTYQIQKKEL